MGWWGWVGNLILDIWVGNPPNSKIWIGLKIYPNPTRLHPRGKEIKCLNADSFFTLYFIIMEFQYFPLISFDWGPFVFFSPDFLFFHFLSSFKTISIFLFLVACIPKFIGFYWHLDSYWPFGFVYRMSYVNVANIHLLYYEQGWAAQSWISSIFWVERDSSQWMTGVMLYVHILDYHFFLWWLNKRWDMEE